MWYSHAHNKIKWARCAPAFVVVAVSFTATVAAWAALSTRARFSSCPKGDNCTCCCSPRDSCNVNVCRYERHWNGKKWSEPPSLSLLSRPPCLTLLSPLPALGFLFRMQCDPRRPWNQAADIILVQPDIGKLLGYMRSHAANDVVLAFCPVNGSARNPTVTSACPHMQWGRCFKA